MLAELCKCGHARERHWMIGGGPGSCSASVDIRHPSTGGDGLRPCPCKGYRPIDNAVRAPDAASVST